jgi:hypothetical protein
MWSKDPHYPYHSTYSASGQSTSVPSFQRRYTSLENALGPDAPWLRPPDHNATATDGGSHPIGTQFGSKPNNYTNKSHVGGETSNIAVEPPAETVEQSLGEAPMTVPFRERSVSALTSLPDSDEDSEMETTSTRPSAEKVETPVTVPYTRRSVSALTSLPDEDEDAMSNTTFTTFNSTTERVDQQWDKEPVAIPSIEPSDTPSISASQLTSTLEPYLDNNQRCRLRNRDGLPCGYPISTFTYAHVRHLLYVHIPNELSSIQSGQLDIEDAELLISDKRVHRAEAFQWSCSVRECRSVTFDRNEMARHLRQGHPDINPHPARRQRPDLDRKSITEVMASILID